MTITWCLPVWAGLGWAGLGWRGMITIIHYSPSRRLTAACLGWAGPRTWESCSSLITRGVTTSPASPASPDSPAQPSPVKWWLFNNMLKSNSDLIVSCNQILPLPQLPHHNCNEKDYNCDFPHCSAPWERPLLLRLTQLVGDVGCMKGASAVLKCIGCGSSSLAAWAAVAPHDNYLPNKC